MCSRKKRKGKHPLVYTDVNKYGIERKHFFSVGLARKEYIVGTQGETCQIQTEAEICLYMEREKKKPSSWLSFEKKTLLNELLVFLVCRFLIADCLY